MRSRSKKLKHYLITIEVGYAHIHAYVMTNDSASINGVVDEMMTLAEKPGVWFLPIILQTELGDGVDVVRDIIRKDENVKRTMDEAIDFHRSIWAMAKGAPDDEKLMELH